MCNVYVCTINKVDLWSAGVILYTMLVGRPPYESTDVKSTYRRILANVYAFPDSVPVSDSAKNLVGRLLQASLILIDCGRCVCVVFVRVRFIISIDRDNRLTNEKTSVSVRQKIKASRRRSNFEKQAKPRVSK